ncbi:glucuronate isomerase [Flavihumibacter rivuli]|uniref:glucuronate isomerase n=1 Tax=Flavihumibacter rivuli TaxID=2838156 RepID=UPI001BDE837E|nr:glucuronate isomerase [Flavihumibacter rivuli]ULQ56999.1 glucuronate isomerase [Flavihumibacter rivuli]
MKKKKRQKAFINENFLLSNKQARQLYFDHAANLPIIDYHCHLSPEAIAKDYRFANMTELWLKGDHYKWRAMRAVGIPEELITGNASDQDKFMAWARVVPHTLRNPLFHWTQMELKWPFGIDDYLNESTAGTIYEACNAMLQDPDYSCRSLIAMNNVELVGTTDDPCDDLRFHREAIADGLSFELRPSFRPDPVLDIRNKEGFLRYIERLELASGVVINDFSSLLQALWQRVEYFHANGCRIADHGLSAMPLLPVDEQIVEEGLRKVLEDRTFMHPDPEGFAGLVLLHLCSMYHAKGWAQQFHLGALRNVSSRLRERLGADSGGDTIGDYPQAERLAAFLDALDRQDRLAPTIIYNLNPGWNEVFAAMAGTFNDGSIAGKVQFGSAWWYLDQKDGIEKQLNALSNLGVLSNFIGMTTDSRSFLSYSRHDYFRRVLCNLLGQEMEAGLLPNDREWIGALVRQLCYDNAKNFFKVG